MAGLNVAGIRRNIKNLAHNYSDAQVKVREATSNDPWGPSSTLMAEIADLTYNVVAFSEIMQMIWKRTNDHGKNWRHVYKALLLLEYLIKTGSEKVAQQCKENIFAIQTLKDFQYLEEGKDQGVHVREKAKSLMILLKDDEKLRNERARALKAKERFARTASGFGSDGSIDGPSTRGDRDTPVWPESDRPPVEGDIEFVRPQTVGEEELQLQLAMAMSREEAEQEEAKRRSDDVRLQLALSQSEQDFKKEQKKDSNLVDLLDISFGATSISSPPQSQPQSHNDPWGLPPPTNSRPPANDIWGGAKPASPVADPWLPSSNNSRTKSPSGTSSSSIEGWLQNVQPPAPGAVPVLPMKTRPIESNDAWLPATQSTSTNASSSVTDPWNVNTSKPPQQVPVASSDPWDPSATKKDDLTSLDPWAPLAGAPRQTNSALAQLTPSSDLDEFDIITNRSKSAMNASSPTNELLNRQNNDNLNNNASLLDAMDPLSSTNSSAPKKSQSKTPQAFLGENSNLVNLDNLIKPNNATSNNNAYNPFSDTPTQPRNLFQQQQPPIPSINQLKQQQAFPITMNQDPWAPINNNEQQNNLNNNNPAWMNQQHNLNNPFLS